MEQCLNRAGLNAIVLRFVFVLLSLHPASALAQTAIDGALTGQITDPPGAAISSATLQAKDLATGVTTQTTSGPDGEFLIPRLPTGEYQITVSARWFKPLIMNHIAVELGSSTELHLKLQLALATTEITVTATDQPTSSAISSTITHTEIDSLPVNARRWQTFTLLTPTANSDGFLLSFQGLAPTQNNTQIDGSAADQSFGAVPRGTSTPEPEREDDGEAGGANRNAGSRRRSGAAYTFSPEAVREFRVSGQNYSALYGHAAGGVVTTVSKSGTNTLHGTGFYLFRTSTLAATNPFSIATTYTGRPDHERSSKTARSPPAIWWQRRRCSNSRQALLLLRLRPTTPQLPRNLRTKRSRLLLINSNPTRPSRQSGSHQREDKSSSELPRQPHRQRTPTQ